MACPDQKALSQEMYWDVMTQGAGHYTDGLFGRNAGSMAALKTVVTEHYNDICSPDVISGAWTDMLQQFVPSSTSKRTEPRPRNELPTVSPSRARMQQILQDFRAQA